MAESKDALDIAGSLICVEVAAAAATEAADGETLAPTRMISMFLASRALMLIGEEARLPVEKPVASNAPASSVRTLNSPQDPLLRNPLSLLLLKSAGAAETSKRKASGVISDLMEGMLDICLCECVWVVQVQLDCLLFRTMNVGGCKRM